MKKTEKKSDIIYAEIKRMIIENELKAMSDISEEALCQKFNTSRTPVHEAILRLGEEGFVYIYPRKSTVVAPISLVQMQHVYELRLMIEPSLAEQACKILTDEQLDEIERELTIDASDMSVDEFIYYFSALDNKLHRMILDCTNNMFIKSAMNRAYDYQHRARIRIAEKMPEFKRAIQDHIDIVRALKARDAELAKDTVLKHLILGKLDFGQLETLD